MMKVIDVDEMIRDLTAMKSAWDAISLDGMIKAMKERVFDAEPIQCGRWCLQRDYNVIIAECPFCNSIWEAYEVALWSYCPHCGANLGGEQNED